MVILMCIFFAVFQQTEGVSPSQSIGCYADATIGGRVVNISVSPEPGDIDGCIVGCGTLGLTYAALTNGYQCFCGDNYNPVPSNACILPCRNNSLEKCGNENVDSMYLVCPPGRYQWTSPTTCQSPCGQCSKQVCQVKTGACLSGCQPGYTGPRCDQDIDECANPVLSGCNQTCVNTLGSYFCTCLGGYTLEEDEKTRRDIDECLNKTLNGCEQSCTNTNGSYFCSCSSENNLRDDKQTCAAAGGGISAGRLTASIATPILCITALILAIVITCVLYKRQEAKQRTVDRPIAEPEHTYVNAIHLPEHTYVNVNQINDQKQTKPKTTISNDYNDIPKYEALNIHDMPKASTSNAVYEVLQK